MTRIADIDDKLQSLDTAEKTVAEGQETVAAELAKVSKTIADMRVQLLTGDTGTGDIGSRIEQAQAHQDSLEQRLRAIEADLAALEEGKARLTEERKGALVHEKDREIEALLRDREQLLTDLAEFVDGYLPLLVALRGYAARAAKLVTERRNAAVVAGVSHFTQDVWLTTADNRGDQAKRLLKGLSDMVLAPGQSMSGSLIETDPTRIREQLMGQ